MSSLEGEVFTQKAAPIFRTTVVSEIGTLEEMTEYQEKDGKI